MHPDEISALLSKIHEESDFRIAEGTISSGIPVRGPCFVGGLVELCTLTQAEYDSIDTKISVKSRIKPLYGSAQIEPFYYADKPKALVVLPEKANPHLTTIVASDRKIVAATMTNRPKFAYVNIPYHIDSSALYVEPSDIDPRVLAAFMNSSVIWFWLKHALSRDDGGLMSIDRAAISRTPLLKPEGTLAHAIKKCANDAYNLKKAKRTYIDLWRTYSSFFKFNSKRLEEIALASPKSDKSRSRRWFLGAELPRQGDDDLTKVYERIVPVALHKERSIRFIGEAGGKAMDLGALFFNNKELLLHVYCAILASNRLNCTSLYDVLKKTEVPLREEDPERQTDYIFKAVATDFHNYIMVEKYVTYDFKIIDCEPLDLPENLSGVEDWLEDTLAKLDAIILKLYDFTTDEARKIIGSLNHESRHRKRAMETFSRYEKLTTRELASLALRPPGTAEASQQEEGEHEGCSHG